MTILPHELRRGKLALIVWSLIIAYMLGVCVLVYPFISTQLSDLGQMFADMSGMSNEVLAEQFNLGDFMTYFSMECGEMLGLGGALFAAIAGASALAKEEREHTAEFLLTHPISRTRIITEKLIATFLQVILLNAVAVAVSVGCILIANVDADAGALALLFLSYLILQLEIAAIAFGISAFLRRSEIVSGLGVAFALYVVYIIANLSDKLDFLNFITPFGYTDGSYIINERSLDVKYIAVGVVMGAAGIAVAYRKYTKKDIA